jgi:hypothetical protein
MDEMTERFDVRLRDVLVSLEISDRVETALPDDDGQAQLVSDASLPHVVPPCFVEAYDFRVSQAPHEQATLEQPGARRMSVPPVARHEPVDALRIVQAKLFADGRLVIDAAAERMRVDCKRSWGSTAIGGAWGAG